MLKVVVYLYLKIKIHLKKLAIVLISIYITIVSCTLLVSAYDYDTGLFLGDEYYIYYDTGVSLYTYTTDGYIITNYFFNTSTNSFESVSGISFSPSNSTNRFQVRIQLPDLIERGSQFDFEFRLILGNMVLDTSSNVNVRGILTPGSGDYCFSVNASINELTSVSWLLTYNGVEVSDSACQYIYFSFYTTTNISSSSTVSINVSSINISYTSSTVILNQIYYLVYLITQKLNSIESDLTSLATILNQINSNLVTLDDNIDYYFSRTASSVNSAISSMSSAVTSAISSQTSSLTSTLITLQNTLNNSITDMKNTLNDSLYDLLGENTDSSNAVNSNDQTNSDLDGITNQYDDIESGLVEDFNTNIGDLNTDLNIFNISDFVQTSTFISTNISNLFNSHSYISYMIMFSLVIGFSLTLIGIKVRR